MRKTFSVNSNVKCGHESGKGLSSDFLIKKMGMVYEVEGWMKDKLIWTRKTENLITTVGAEQILMNLMPASGETAITAWYLSGMAAPSGDVTTGSMSASSTTLTLATAFGTEGVVGQVITVIGAGSGGGNLVTTISSITSTTDYVLATAASTAVTGAACILGPVMAIGDTSASHSGWTEMTTSQVTQTTRLSYTVAAVSTSSGNAIKTNSASPASYTGNTPTWWMTGVFLASSDVFGSTTDTLLSEAAFDANATPPGAVQVTSGMTINLKAQFSAIAS